MTTIHDNAQKAAEAAEAAGAQGEFWAYHDLLFETQSQWSDLDGTAARDFFVVLARDLSLDVGRFTADLDEDVYAAYVSSLQAEAQAIGLPGTPAVLLDGVVLASNNLPRDFEIWQDFVESVIQREEALAALAESQYSAPPPMTIDLEATYLARVELESGGEFVLEMYPESAPETVNSFVFLAEEGWFDGVTFHRVIPGFVAQTGDPTGLGVGGPGYTIPNEIDPGLSHDGAGVVAMANSGPDTNGSQWYITLAPALQLDGSYTIFGRVVEGLDVVQAITPRDPRIDPDAPPGDRILRVAIETST